jgi:uncharacterized protein DUF1835
MLHVTNGESAASTLRGTSLEGVVLSWDDVLHVGPLAFEPAESRALRARFLAEHGWGEESGIVALLERRDELVARADAVALWFEHDLFDQLQLLQVLSQVSEDAAITLVQADEYLGSLEPAALERLWDSRRPVGEETRTLSRVIWRAVCDDELEHGLGRDTSELPHLDAALRRLAEERAPLPRTKRQLLSALRDGPKTPPQLFAASQALEEEIFLGDAWCFRFLYELAQDGYLEPAAGGELPLPPPRGDSEGFTSIPLALTVAGRELV